MIQSYRQKRILRSLEPGSALGEKVEKIGEPIGSLEESVTEASPLHGPPLFLLNRK